MSAPVALLSAQPDPELKGSPGSTSTNPPRATIAAVHKAKVTGIVAGVVGGAIYAAWRAYRARMPAATTGGSWEPAPFPFPPIPRPSVIRLTPPTPTPAPKPAPASETETWLEPVDGECPPTHPVKGKLTSGIYHRPGGLNYVRTRPDRCYVDAAAAEAAGLRASKR